MPVYREPQRDAAGMIRGIVEPPATLGRCLPERAKLPVLQVPQPVMQERARRAARLAEQLTPLVTRVAGM